MKLSDFRHVYNEKELKPSKKNEEIAKVIAASYLKTINEKYLYVDCDTYLEAIFLEYLKVKGTPKEEVLLNLLKEHNINYQATVREGIYHLLVKETERIPNVKAKNWPGINSVKKENNKYILDTQIGRIEVYKATEMISSPVLNKQLGGCCYERTYDFLKQNPDYKATIAYLPNFFTGGMYHAYLENEDGVFDIAANAYYKDLDSAEKVLKGEKVETLSLKEAKNKIKVLRKTIDNLPKTDELLNVGLYYEIKNKH